MAKDDVKIDGKMKTKMTNDWLIEFPEYKKVHPQNIKKRIGCLLFGIWYDISYSTNIKPVCSFFNLSNPLDFICANLKMGPKVKSLYNFTQHARGAYKEAASSLRQFSPIPLEGNITLSQIINGYKNYTGNVVEERHFEDPALIAAWCGQIDVAKDCLDWGMQAYQSHCKIPYRNISSFDEWYAHMLTRIDDPETLHRIVDEQIIHHKLEKIPYQNIIIDI